MRPLNRIEAKTEDERVERLKSLPYSVLLKQRNDRFYFIIPELSLVGVGDDLEEAYEDLCGQRDELFANLIDCGAEGEIALPRSAHANDETFHQMKVFLYKLVVVCVIGGLAFLASGALLVNKVAQISAVDMLKNQIRGIVSEAERSIIYASEDRKQERLREIRRFVEGVRPLVKELHALLPSPADEEEGINGEVEK